MLNIGPVGENFSGQLVNALHHAPCVGPLVHIFFICLFTLREVARNGGIIGQASGEELAFVLQGRRITNDTPDVPTDLCHVNKVKTARHGVGHRCSYRLDPDDIPTRQVQ